MKKLLPVLGIALLGLGLAGCSSAESAPQSTPTSPAVAPATPVDAGRGEATDEGEKSERGNIIKKVGQAAGILGDQTFSALPLAGVVAACAAIGVIGITVGTGLAVRFYRARELR